MPDNQTQIMKPAATQLAELRDLERKNSEESKSKASKRAYASDWQVFQKWCLEVDLSSLPCQPDTIRLYVTYLDKIGRKPSTIKRCLTSIRKAHMLSGHASPVTEAVKETCQGIYRLRGIVTGKKSALTIDKLDRILHFIGGDFLGVRDRALLLVGWTGALRRSELISIDVEDIEQEPEGIVITIRKSKIDQLGAGKQIGLPFVAANHKLCAASALQKWISISGIRVGAAFRRVGKIGRNRVLAPVGGRISDKQVTRLIKIYAELAGYNPDKFGGHSLRSGLATTLASIGIEERKIMQITGHRSVAMLREYIERGELFREHPVLAIFAATQK